MQTLVIAILSTMLWLFIRNRMNYKSVVGKVWGTTIWTFCYQFLSMLSIVSSVSAIHDAYINLILVAASAAVGSWLEIVTRYEMVMTIKTSEFDQAAEMQPPQR